MDQNLYYERDLMTDSPMSLWSSQLPHVYKPLTIACTTQQKQHSNCSTPSTPPYSQTLALENQMVGPSITQGLIGNNSRQHLAAPAAISMVVPLEASRATTVPASGKRTRKNFVDPCAIAPLKKRRIQVDLLSPDDRDKVLQKREKNKVAAEKCRVKRRQKVQETRAEYDSYLEANENLDAQIRRLKEERQMLAELLKEHKCMLQIPAQ